MSFELQGTLLKKYDMESKSATFQTREFVVTTEETYPQYVKFQLTQDKCGILDGFAEGQKVKVHFDLRGREWQGKYFTNLNAWRMEGLETQAPEAKSESSGFDSFEPVENPFSNTPQDFDDLPF